MSATRIRRCRPRTAASASRPTSPGTRTATSTSATATSIRASPRSSKDGDWIKSWGERGTGPGEFNTPHSIAADAKGNIYVADRSNRRIQVFDGDGKFQREIKIDVPFDREREARDRQQAGPADLSADRRHAWRRARRGRSASRRGRTRCCTRPTPIPGRIYKLSLDGKVLGVLGESGKQLKQFGWIHEMACPSENELYVAEILNWRVQKLILHPGKEKRQ